MRKLKGSPLNLFGSTVKLLGWRVNLGGGMRKH